MKNAKKLFGVLLVLMLSVGNLFSQDTVFVNGADTSLSLPTGFEPVDTVAYVDSTVSLVKYFDTTGVMVATNRNGGVYQEVVAQNNSTVVYRVFRLGTTSTRIVNISVNGSTIKHFANNELNNDTTFTDTLNLKQGDVVKFTSTNNGAFGVDLNMTSRSVTYDTLVVINIDKVQSTGFGFDENKIEFSMYPNPVVNRLNFKFDNDPFDVSVEIYNMGGRLLKQEAMFDNSIDVSFFPIGTYVIKLKVDGKVSSTRFSKQ